MTTLTAQQLEFLKGIDSPTIANAIEVFKLQDRCEGFIGGRVRCLFPELGTMVGHAVTVTMSNKPGPVAGRAGFWKMFDALEASPKPSVLVCQDVSGHPTRVAYAGEVMATLMWRLGCVGMVTDGALRDLNEVKALGLHFFARYAVVSHANFEIVDVNTPVTLDGCTVHPGDILHGDINGISVIPHGIVDELPKVVAGIREREGEAMAYIKGPDFSLDGYKKRSGY